LVANPENPNSPENSSWPAPTKIGTQPGPLTVFYTAASGFVECLRVEAEQNMVYRLMRSYASQVSEMEVDILSVSTAVAMVSLFHTLPVSPSAAIVVGARTIFRRFDVMPVALNYFVVRSGPTVALLTDKGMSGIGFVAGAIASAGTQTVAYMLRKTAAAGLYVTGYLAATVAAGFFIYSTSSTSKKRKSAK